VVPFEVRYFILTNNPAELETARTRLKPRAYNFSGTAFVSAQAIGFARGIRPSFAAC
jgi:hypothetical protein